LRQGTDTSGEAFVEEFERLELSTETLRELTPEELTEVAGGVEKTPPIYAITQTVACPSGATWFAPCDSVQIGCG
jgi:hypothetical protein